MKSLNIVLALDKNVAVGAGVLICSVLINNPNMFFNIELFAKKDDLLIIQSKLDFRLKRLNFNNYKINYNNIEEIDCFNQTISSCSKCMQVANSNLTIAALYRLLVFDYLYQKYDQALYLDTDILCVGKLDYLTELDLDNYILAAVKDVPMQIFIAHSRYNLVLEDYFNSGVLLVNINAWHKFNITNKLIDLLVNKNLYQLDQDALNIICQNQVRYLPAIFNVVNPYVLPSFQDSILIHYTGYDKPWKPWVDRNHNMAYRIYAKALKVFEPDTKLWFSLKEDTNTLWNPNVIFYDYKSLAYMFLYKKHSIKLFIKYFIKYKIMKKKNR